MLNRRPSVNERSDHPSRVGAVSCAKPPNDRPLTVSEPMDDGPGVRSIESLPQDSEDAGYVSHALAGDLRAFDRLIERYQRRALSVAYRLVGNVDDASEVVQEAFLRAYRSLDTLDAPRRFGAWLMRIVSNLSLNHRRARRPTLSLSTDDRDGEGHEGNYSQQVRSREPAPGETVLSKELERRINEVVDGLPEKQRLALILFAVEGMPQKEVAEILEVSVEAVKWHVFQARKIMREHLAEYLTE